MIKHLIPRKTLLLRIPRFGKGSPFDRLTRTRWGRAQLRFVLGKADAVIPLTTDATNILKAWGLSEERIARIPNGVEADRFYPATEDEKRVLKRSFGIAENAFVGVLVARLIPRSNAALALKAWKRVCGSRQKLHTGQGIPKTGGCRRLLYAEQVGQGRPDRSSGWSNDTD